MLFPRELLKWHSFWICKIIWGFGKKWSLESTITESPFKITYLLWQRRSLPSRPDLMRLHVFLHVRFLRKRPPADDTLKRFLPRMAAHMLRKIKRLIERTLAIITLQFALLFVGGWIAWAAASDPCWRNWEYVHTSGLQILSRGTLSWAYS